MPKLIDRLDDWLCENWRNAWKWFSMQMHLFACALLMFLQIAPVMPDEVRRMIPEPWGVIAVGVWTLLGIVARLKKQNL